MPQSTNVMHWSSEARRVAAASALEAKRVASQRDAGSAKVSLLPHKVRRSGARKRDDTYGTEYVVNSGRMYVAAATFWPLCSVGRVGLDGKRQNERGDEDEAG